MRIRALVLVVMATAVGAQAATVVLKGGKRLDVERFTRSGNAVVVQFADGRFVSYPLNAVDLSATATANATAEAPQPTPTPEGPHSPFFAAQSTEGGSVLVITDADVAHVDDTAGEQATEDEADQGSGGAVVLRGWEKRQVEPGVWEITATIANTGEFPVQAINASIGLADREGERLGSATAAYPGRLEPGEQGVITVRVPSEAEPMQVTFDFQWQSIRPVPQEQPAEATGAPAPSPRTPPAAATPPGFTVPPGSSPNAMPANPMAVPPDLTSPPIPPSVPRPTPEPGR